MDATLPPAEIKALSDKVMEEINVGMQWRIRALQAEAKVKELQAELDKLKPKEEQK